MKQEIMRFCESEVVACDGSVAVIKAVTADHASRSMMVDLQPTLVRRFTGLQTQSSRSLPSAYADNTQSTTTLHYTRLTASFPGQPW